MKRLGFVVAAFALLVTTTFGTATAVNVATYIAPQPDSPVQVTACYGAVRYLNNGWGTHYTVLDTGADFRDDSSKTVAAVLIRFELSSVFGDVMDNLFGQAAGQFSTATVIQGNKWTTTDAWPGLGIVRCSISRVLFTDGSVWRAIGMPTPSPGP